MSHINGAQGRMGAVGQQGSGVAGLHLLQLLDGWMPESRASLAEIILFPHQLAPSSTLDTCPCSITIFSKHSRNGQRNSRSSINSY